MSSRGAPPPNGLINSTSAIDAIDARLIGTLRAAPMLPVVELARRVGVARGTAQARLARMHDRGVVVGYGPDLSRHALGYGVLAFTTLEIDQAQGAAIVAGLDGIPQVLEVHTMTGPGDLLCRIVATSNDHLHDVLTKILALPGIRRTQTQLALSAPIDRTLADVLEPDPSTNPVVEPIETPGG